MKKLLFVLFAVWCGAMTAAAQDLIVKTDASQVEARVLEISPDAVRYKRFSNPDGPTYVLPVAEIRYIRYANGEVEYYAKEVPAEPLTPARSAGEAQEQAAGETEAAPQAEAPRPAPEYVLRRYEVGDLYDRDGVKGVVCIVSDEGTHGLVISLEQIYLTWS